MLAGAEVVVGDDDEAGGADEEIANVEGRAATYTWAGGRRVDDDEETCSTSLFTGARSINCDAEAVDEV